MIDQGVVIRHGFVVFLWMWNCACVLHGGNGMREGNKCEAGGRFGVLAPKIGPGDAPAGRGKVIPKSRYLFQPILSRF